MKRILLSLLFVALAAVVAVLMAVRLRPAPAGPARTVEMRMYDYTFNGTNPTIEFKPGERVHFVVRNDEDSPVKHNFRIVGLDVPCEREMLPGEVREVTVTLPRSGEFAYTCCTHPGMGGKLVIREK